MTISKRAGLNTLLSLSSMYLTLEGVIRVELNSGEIPERLNLLTNSLNELGKGYGLESIKQYFGYDAIESFEGLKRIIGKIKNKETDLEKELEYIEKISSELNGIYPRARRIAKGLPI